MLPTEAFAKAIASLRLFDLSALAVANSICSSFAVKTSSTIRWEEFTDLNLNIRNGGIEICRPLPKTEDGLPRWAVTMLTFGSEIEMIEFVATAFLNCIFEDVVIWTYRNKNLLEDVGQVADAVAIRGTLQLNGSISFSDSINLLKKFRKVKGRFLSYF